MARSRNRWVAGLAAAVALLVLTSPTGPHPLGAHAPGASPSSPAGIRALAQPSATLAATFVITNHQSVATGYYDQPLLLNSTDFPGRVNANFSNVEFETSTYSTVPSWIESLGAPARVWLALPSIAPHASLNVLMLASPLATFVLASGGPAGEAPDLSGTYGQPGYGAWDDGPLVFPYYRNFAGTTLPSDWRASSGITYTQSNGLHITGEGSYDPGIFSTTNFSALPLAVDFYAQVESTGGVTFAGLMVNPSSSNGCASPGDCRDIIQSDSRTQSNAIEGEVGNTGAAIYTPFYSIGWNGNATYTIDVQGPKTVFEVNYSEARTVTYSVGALPFYLEAWSTGNVPHTTSVDGYFSWIRVRSPGPNDVLPSVALAGVGVYGLRAVAASNSSLYLSWSNPSDPSIINDTVFVGTTCGTWQEALSTGGVTQDWLVGGLRPNSSYCVAVAAWNASGIGPLTTGVTARTVAAVPLGVLGFGANPSRVATDAPTLFEARVIGGSPPYSYAYSGLPGGCLTGSTDRLACTPAASGLFEVTLTVTDSAGARANASTELTVGTPSGGAAASSAIVLLGLSWTEIGLLVGVVLLAIVAAIGWARRRPPVRPPPSAPWIAPPIVPPP